MSEDLVLEVEGQLCWTGTVRRPGGQSLGGGWLATIAIEQIAQSVVTWSVVTADGWGRGSENCWGVKRGRTMVGSCNHQCGESLNINGALVKACQASLKFELDN